MNRKGISPLPEVNQMLIADKIQNRKDFELYHQKTHPRNQELQLYFRNWLEKSGISEDRYQFYCQKNETLQIKNLQGLLFFKHFPLLTLSTNRNLFLRVPKPILSFQNARSALCKAHERNQARYNRANVGSVLLQ